MSTHSDNLPTIPWKIYINITVETVIGFCIATFSFAMFLLHGGIQYFYSLLMMIFLYGFAIGLFVHRIVKNFSLPALMLMIPIAPLIVLLLAISLLPILQLLK